MSRQLGIVLLLFAANLHAQIVDWHRVEMNSRVEQLPYRQPPLPFEPTQRRTLRRIMATDQDVRIATANTGPYDDRIVFTALRLRLGSPTAIAVKVDGDQLHACCWIVDLATPARILGHIGGERTWGDWVQPPAHHGFHDFIEAHHLSADQFALEYFRFNGRSYERIASDLATRCDPRDQSIYCLSDGFRFKD